MQKIVVPDVGKFGMVADIPPQELPLGAWSSLTNMRCKDGCLERFEGETSLFTTPSVTPYYIDYYQTGDQRYFVHAGTEKVFVDDGSTRTEITPGSLFTGSRDNRWSGGTLGGVLVMNNFADQPCYWGGNTANNLATLPGWNSAWRASVIRPFKEYLIALDITKSGVRYANMVKWSAAAEPGTVPTSWDEADPTIDAGEVDLAEETSILMDGLALGDMFVIYKERALYAMTYGGFPFVWTFRKLPGDVGTIARGCVAAFPGGHVSLTAGDVIAHAGQGPQSIIDGRNRKWLFNNIDSTYHQRSFVVNNPAKNEIWVCFPIAGSDTPNMALVWNYKEDTWTTRELANATYGAVGQLNASAVNTWANETATWATDDGTWNSDLSSPAAARLVLSATAPKILLTDYGYTFDGTAFTSTAERTGLTFGENDRVKVLRGIYPRIDAAAATNVTVSMGATMDVETSTSYSDTAYTVGSSYKADGFASGRALAVKFASTDNSRFRIRSFDMDVKGAGLF